MHKNLLTEVLHTSGKKTFFETYGKFLGIFSSNYRTPSQFSGITKAFLTSTGFILSVQDLISGSKQKTRKMLIVLISMVWNPFNKVIYTMLAVSDAQDGIETYLL